MSRYEVTPRFGVVVLTLTLAVLLTFTFVNRAAIAGLREDVGQLTTACREQRAENSYLAEKARFSDTREYVIRLARGMGMMFPGETRFTLTGGSAR